MTFKTGANSQLGVPNFQPTIADTTPMCPVGTIVKAFDDVQGDAEMIYLPGVASLAAGDLVIYNLLPGGQGTVRVLNNAVNNTGQPCAVALSATLAGQYGWFQISGAAIVNAIAATAIGAMYASSTAGQVTSVADAGDQIIGARIHSAVGTPSAGKVYATINRPHIQGQIT